MGAKITSISLTNEQYDFVNNNSELNLSKIAQSAINNIMERHQIVQKDIDILKKKNEKMQIYIEKLTEFIEKVGLWEKFLSSADLGAIFPK